LTESSVASKLSFKLVHRIQALPVTEALFEFDGDVKPVYILRKAEYIGLDDVPDIGHAIETASHRLNFGEVHSALRNHLQRLIKLHVGRGETDCAPELFAAHNDSAHRILVTEHGRSILHPSFRQSCAYLGRTDYQLTASKTGRRHHDDIHSEPAGQLPDLRRVKLIRPEPVVIAKQHSSTSEAVSNNVHQIFLCRHGSKISRKVQNLNPVHPERLKHGNLFGR